MCLRRLCVVPTLQEAAALWLRPLHPRGHDVADVSDRLLLLRVAGVRRLHPPLQEGWQQPVLRGLPADTDDVDLDDYGNEEIKILYAKGGHLVEAQGYTKAQVFSEWYTLIVYVMSKEKLHTLPHKQIWIRIHLKHAGKFSAVLALSWRYKSNQ